MNESRTDGPEWTAEVPFDAWDLIASERCRVIGWYDRTHYRLASGTIARLDSVTTVFPAWLADAEQALADARDEAATVEDVRYGGAM
jgi:hypothetical protein